MMKFNLNNERIAFLNGVENTPFPKYTSQLMNLANQNAQGTRQRALQHVQSHVQVGRHPHRCQDDQIAEG